MKYLDQTLFGAEEGNCFQVTIANYLGCPLDMVPNFCKGATNGDWWEVAKGWCLSNNLTPVELKLCSLGHMNKGCSIWVVGFSPRDPQMQHAVLGVVSGDGKWNLVHDPHPSREGLAQAVQFGFMVPHNQRSLLSGGFLGA